MRNALSLTDEELYDSSNGTASIEMVREIIEKDGVVDENGKIVVDQFAQWFAYSLEDLIGSKPDSEEWLKAWRENYDWGFVIAEKLNKLLG